MRHLTAIVCALPGAVLAQDLLFLEINGPSTLVAGADAEYQCIAHFDEGSIDVTGMAAWFVEPSLLASMEGGHLTTHAGHVTLQVGAAYALGDDEADAGVEVRVVEFGDKVESDKITDPAGVSGDKFGRGVAVSGETAITLSDAGAFVYDVSDPAELLHLATIEPGALVIDVAMHGDLAILGVTGLSPTGIALIYDLSDPAAPILVSELTAADGLEDLEFGFRVAIHGDLAAVTRRREPGAPVINSGTVFVFDISDPAHPVELSELAADEEANSHDYFGSALAASDSIIVVGAHRDATAGTGAVYLFDAATGAKLTKKVIGVDDAQFGFDVAIDGDVALFGTDFECGFCIEDYSAYLFDISNPAVPSFLAKFDVHETAFGSAVDLSHEWALVGARGDRSAFAYNIADPSFPIMVTKLTSTDSALEFGRCVSINDDTVLVGARYADGAKPSTGAAYSYDLAAIPCPADVNGDDVLNVLDLVTFQLSWRAQISIADCNDDDAFTVEDFTCYWAAYAIGCP